MAPLQGRPISSGIGPTQSASRPEIDVLHRLQKAAEATRAQAKEGSSLRVRILQIGVEAEKIQHAACSASEALERLGSMEETLSFALDAAREARNVRTLPVAVLENLQKQVDLAVSCVDCHAQQASFSGSRLFRGGSSIEVGRERFELPSLSSRYIGGNWVSSASPWQVDTGEVEYSQCVASVATGGPNSLEQWADGAANALEAGLAHLGRLRGSLEAFYNANVLPAVSELAVTLANAVATDFKTEGFEEATALLAEIGSELGAAGPGTAAGGEGKGVLRLLE